MARECPRQKTQKPPKTPPTVPNMNKKGGERVYDSKRSPVKEKKRGRSHARQAQKKGESLLSFLRGKNESFPDHARGKGGGISDRLHEKKEKERLFSRKGCFVEKREKDNLPLDSRDKAKKGGRKGGTNFPFALGGKDDSKKEGRKIRL